MFACQVLGIRVLGFGGRPRIHSLERQLSLASVLLLSLDLTSPTCFYSDRTTTEHASANLSNCFFSTSVHQKRNTPSSLLTGIITHGMMQRN